MRRRNVSLIRRLYLINVVKTISCREAGFDCDYVVKGETEEEVMKNGAEHVQKVHGIKEEDMTPEMKQKIRGFIRTP
jgi:predicted small metal-binding protein